MTLIQQIILGTKLKHGNAIFSNDIYYDRDTIMDRHRSYIAN